MNVFLASVPEGREVWLEFWIDSRLQEGALGEDPFFFSLSFR